MASKPKVKRARPVPGKPYLRWGKWVVRDEGNVLHELTAQNERDAAKEAARVLRRAAGAVQVVPSTQPPIAPPGSPPSFQEANPADPLGAWLSGPPLSAEAEDEDEPESENDAPTQWSADDPVASPSLPAAKPAASMTITSAERDQFRNLLSGIVARANVITLGYTVKLFGRQPAEPSEADTALLEKAWAAQLNMWFGDTEIQPWVLILAASAGMGLGMWAGGEPLPPKTPNGRPNLSSVPMPNQEANQG